MGLQSFRELLLRKTAGNNSLTSFVQEMGEDIFALSVLETLEKMARVTHSMGSRANAPLTTLATNLDDSDVEMIRDALSHHMSHYRAALKAHHEATDPQEKAKMRAVADQHLNHLIPMMHMVGKMSAHSGGKIDMDYPDELPAWEANYTTLVRNDTTGRYKLDPKLLGARPSPNARVYPNGRGIRDYHYLEMPPHHGHPAWERMPHEGGYPWEEVRIGSRSQVDSKEGYVDIHDVPDKKEYTPHPFDFHPIRQLAGKEELHDVSQAYLSQDDQNKFAEDLANWKNGDHYNQWMQSQEELYNSDPEGYERRGKTKSKPLYDGIPLMKQFDHVDKYPKKPKKLGAPAAEGAEPTASNMSIADKIAAIKAGKPVNAGFTVRKKSQQEPAPAPSGLTPEALESMYNTYKALPEGHSTKKLFEMNPTFKQYAQSKEGSGK